MNWFQRIGVLLTPYAWATHILIALVMQSVIAGGLILADIPNPWWLAAMVAVGFFWSREKTEYEFELKAQDHQTSVGSYWYRGFVMFEWDRPSWFQFLAPATAVTLLACALR